MDDEQDEFENYYGYAADQWPGPPGSGDDVPAEPDSSESGTTDADRPRGLLAELVARLFRRS